MPSMSRSVVSGPPTSAAPLQLQSEGQRRGGAGERGESVGMACSISQEAVCGRKIRYGDLFGAHLSGREASHTGGMPASLLAASLPPRCPCQTNASSVCVLKTRVETTCQSAPVQRQHTVCHVHVFRRCRALPEQREQHAQLQHSCRILLLGARDQVLCAG